jgi:hypothetical protein
MNSIKSQSKILRQEFKYYISHQTSLALKSQLRNYMDLDENANESSSTYKVRSLYFDTIDQDDFTEKVDGLYSREKFRVRSYDESSNIFKFESKKRTDLAIKKTSEIVDIQTVESIVSGDYDALLLSNSTFLNNAYGKLKASGYRPRVIVEYDRVAYCLPYNNIRITLDLNLRTYNSCVDLINPNIASSPVFKDNAQILEIKFTGFLPPYLKLLISKFISTRNSISKFVLCQQQISHDPWADVIDKPF